MTRKDLAAACALAAALLLYLAPVWASARPAFANFGDLWAYHWPLRAYSASSLAEGRFPLWDPYILLGLPHAANPQSALFYPLSTLGFLLPSWAALAWDQVLHLLWAGLGAFLLARTARAPRGAAFALGAAYALSPFLAYRVAAGIPTLAASLSWAPWAWLAWLGGSTALLCAVWALQLLSGHPQFLVVNAAAMALWAAARPERLSLWARGAAAACFALVLGALQWVPTLALLRGSNRSGWPAEFASSYSLEPAALKTWLWPGALGTPGAGWPQPPSVFFESAGVWLGASTLALAAWGLLRGRARGRALLLAGAGTALALGANGPFAALLTSPGFSYLRTPSRWSFLVLWAVWLLAGAGLSLLERRRAGGAALAAALVFVELAAWDARFLKREDPERYLAPSAAVAAAVGGKPLRVMTDPELASSNKTILYRARNANGYEAFYPASAARWAAEADGAPAADSSRVAATKWRSETAARAGVAVRLSPAGLETTDAAWPLAAFIDRDGRRVTPDPVLSVERPERWRVTGPVPAGAAAVALAEQRWSGWTARLSGAEAPLSPWGAAFSLVSLPTGTRSLDLDFRFEPAGRLWLVLLSAAAWAAWLAGLGRAAREVL